MRRNELTEDDFTYARENARRYIFEYMIAFDRIVNSRIFTCLHQVCEKVGIQPIPYKKQHDYYSTVFFEPADMTF